jgi:hypothetical protein
MLGKTVRLIIAASCLAQAAIAPAQAVDVKRFMETCEGNRLCPWFLAVTAPPAGWRIDEDFGRRNRMLALLPDKEKLGPRDPLIYVRTTFNGDDRSLDVQAANSNQRWREAAGKVEIERLPDIARKAGAGVWQVYRYRNFDRPRQAYELLAFGEHGDSGGQKFFYMVALSGAQRDIIDAAETAWREVLDNL